MTHTYVIPDIHGRLDLLEKALTQIETEHPPGTVVFLGDYVDRGRQSAQVISRVMAGPITSGFEWVTLMGNHENMMLLGLSEPRKFGVYNWWAGNGGDTTMESYGGQVPESHLAWLRGLPMVWQDEHRVYVHASVDENRNLDEQDPEYAMWKRHATDYNVGYNGKHVVHGHTPMENGPIKNTNRTNLDTGAFFTGRLVVGIFLNDRAGGPVDLIEVFDH